MKKNSIQNKIKSKVFLTLLLVSILCFSLCLFTACGKTEKAADDSTYTKVETDESTINNGSFEFGLSGKTADSYPITTSITGWGSTTTENSVTSSTVSSGIVSTDDDIWKATMSTFYSESDFIEGQGIDLNAIKAQKKLEFPDKTDEEIEVIVKDYVLDNNLKALNPKTHEGAVGKNIFMINNYTGSKLYSAQTSIASSTISIEKNTYGKITLWIYAQNIKSYNDFGVNIRLNGYFNSNAINQYILSGITSTDNAWKQYTIYLKGDSNYTTTVTPVISLGYANKTEIYTETAQGTVYFDDIVYTEIEKSEYESAGVTAGNTKVFDYTSEVNLIQTVDAETKYAYSLNLYESPAYSTYFTKYATLSADISSYNYLESNVLTNASEKVSSKTKFGTNSDLGSYTVNDNDITITGIKNASTILTINNLSTLLVAPNSYMFFTFKLSATNINMFGSKTLTIYVIDKDGTYNIAGSYTIDDEEEIDCGFIVSNNESDIEPSSTNKTFSFAIVVGPTDVASSNYLNDYFTGNILIRDVRFASGKTYQYEKDTDGNIVIVNNEKVKTTGFTSYSLLSSSYQNVALGDDNTDSQDTYTINFPKSETGKITYSPVITTEFTGVVSNHAYVKPDGTETKINTRAGAQGDGANFAGLINSSYGYNDPSYPELQAINISDALAHYCEKSIQPLMIYNATKDSYGFIGNSFTIDASSNAMISVKVRVVGDAVANIYLVDTSKVNKQVASLTYNNGNEDVTKLLQFTNIISTEAETDGFRTFTFYIATGKDAMNLRLELWNGSRSGEEASKSQGFVFFAFDAFDEDETFTYQTLSGAFTEAESASTAYTTSGNPLYSAAYEMSDSSIINNSIAYTRQLDATEIKFNKEYPDDAVSYESNYIWANCQSKDCSIVYAVYNTINPVAVDPYESKEDDTSSGCTATTDPSTFWLSFSSILLGVVLVLAIIALIVKTTHRRRVANKNDAKSHYKVTSRYTAPKKKAKKVVKEEVEDLKDESLEGYEETDKPAEEPAKEEKPSEETTEITADKETEEYIYGDIQSFGDNATTETIEEKKDSVEEKKDEGKTE